MLVSPVASLEDVLVSLAVAREGLGIGEVFVGGRPDGWQDDFLKRADENPNRRGLELAPEAYGVAAPAVRRPPRGGPGGQGSQALWAVGTELPVEGAAARLAGLTIVAQAINDDALAQAAEVLLPASTHAESDGTFVNFEGRAQRFELAYFPRGESRPHWFLSGEIGRALGLAFAYRQRARRLPGARPRLGGCAGRFPLGRAPVAGQAPRHHPAGRRNRGWSAGRLPRAGAAGDQRGPAARPGAVAGRRAPVKRFFGMIAVLVGCSWRWCSLTAVAYGVAGWCGVWANWIFSKRRDGPGVRLARWPHLRGRSISNILILMLGLLMTAAGLLTVAERKWSAMMQNRIGANRIKVFGNPLGGIPYLLADALKMLTKERVEPRGRTRFLYELAPILSFAPVFALFAVVPVGPPVAVSSIRVPRCAQVAPQIALQVANPDVGLLYVFAIASLAVYGTSLAGWSSNNKLALLGGVRASSQMISYEVSLGLSLVGCMLAYRTLRLEEMVVAQGNAVIGPIPALGILLQPVGFLIFFASAFAETKRAPFDLPEGESEIVGYFVEYSGMKFGLMFLAEFAEIVVLSGIVTAVFLGGWHPILFEGWLRERALAVLVRVARGRGVPGQDDRLMWLQLTIRWLLPRFRYDQIQKLCWKLLLPVALANVFVTAAVALVDPSLTLLAWVGIATLVVIGIHHRGGRTSARSPRRPTPRATRRPPPQGALNRHALPARATLQRTSARSCTSRPSSAGIADLTRHFLRNLFFSRDPNPDILARPRGRFGNSDNVTLQYPEEKQPYPPGYRGLHRLVPREDGKPRCVACYMCATICPAQCIYIEAGEYPDDPIEKYPVRFVIDELRCIVCGFCVEACPKDAIRMDTGEHTPPSYQRSAQIWDEKQLLRGPPVSYQYDPWLRRGHPGIPPAELERMRARRPTLPQRRHRRGQPDARVLGAGTGRRGQAARGGRQALIPGPAAEREPRSPPPPALRRSAAVVALAGSGRSPSPRCSPTSAASTPSSTGTPSFRCWCRCSAGPPCTGTRSATGCWSRCSGAALPRSAGEPAGPARAAGAGGARSRWCSWRGTRCRGGPGSWPGLLGAASLLALMPAPWLFEYLGDQPYGTSLALVLAGLIAAEPRPAAHRGGPAGRRGRSCRLLGHWVNAAAGLFLAPVAVARAAGGPARGGALVRDPEAARRSISGCWRSASPPAGPASGSTR